jgi:hypothetical protein
MAASMAARAEALARHKAREARCQVGLSISCAPTPRLCRHLCELCNTRCVVSLSTNTHTSSILVTLTLQVS